MGERKDDQEQWILLLKEARTLGMTVKEIKDWFNDNVVSKKETG